MEPELKNQEKFETIRVITNIDSALLNGTKTTESQIVLGLPVNEGGYPLSYSIFNGSQYEGRTMLPIIDDFISRFSIKEFVVMANCDLISNTNVKRCARLDTNTFFPRESVVRSKLLRIGFYRRRKPMVKISNINMSVYKVLSIARQSRLSK